MGRARRHQHVMRSRIAVVVSPSHSRASAVTGLVSLHLGATSHLTLYLARRRSLPTAASTLNHHSDISHRPAISPNANTRPHSIPIEGASG